MRRRYVECERRSPRSSWFILFFLLMAIFFFNYFGKKLAGNYPRILSDIVLVDSRGKLIPLPDQGNKYRVLLFVTAGCLPCEKQIKVLERLSLPFVKKIVIFVDGAVPDRYKGRKGFYYLYPREVERVVGALGVSRVPTIFIVDEKGLIRRKVEGFIDLEDLEAFLKVVRRYGV